MVPRKYFTFNQKLKTKNSLHPVPRPRRGPTSPEIADFASCRREFFGKYIDLSNGLPTDTADRVAYSIRRHYAIESKHWQLDLVLCCRTSLKKAENKVNKRPLFSALFVFNAK
jgi:hypothetical protein